MKSTLLLFSLFISLFYSAQKGKNGDFSINSLTIVNEYSILTSDANTNDIQLTISETTLNTNNRFPSVLSKGDLILIIQHQGVTIDAHAEPWTGDQTYGLPRDSEWGQILNYNNCGNYEYAEIKSVNSSAQISLICGLKNNYTATGKVQIVRIPRYKSLTVSNTITADSWNGSKGGILAIEVQGDLTINAGGFINTNGLGFRGGVANLVSSINGSDDFASKFPTHGGMKGESLAGYDDDYLPYGGQYGKAAPANAGGGSAAHNAGGGGGANGGDVNNWINGVGIPNSTYNTAWALETPSISGVISSGGGKGGYTFSANDENANTTPPGDGSWGSDDRRQQGGFGGRPLDYSTGKIFFGGGGGSGDRNDSENEGGSGGNAGGIILIKAYGDILGTGTITSNGENGENIFTNNPPLTSYAGNDGAGGGGAGGTIIINNTSTSSISNLIILGNGGNGGNQILESGAFYFFSITEAEGPGGGAGGGYISIPLNSATITTLGGANGTTNSSGLTEFPPNGATSGHEGINTSSSSIIALTSENDTVCLGQSGSLTALTDVALPNNHSIIWYDENMTMIATGINFTTGPINNDTTFYVGICPGNGLVEVQVIIGASFTVDNSSLIIQNEHCNQNDGSITGLTVSGGALPLVYTWNTTMSNSIDTNNLATGSYQLIITDNDGCSSVVGDYTISNETPPEIVSNSSIINHENCNQGNGSITNTTINNGTSPYTYQWSNGETTLELNNLSAGNYDLIVTDNFGCNSTSNSFIINNELAPQINNSNILITPETCDNSNGAISNITINGGNTPYSYNWNNSYSTLDIDNLEGNNNYQLIVTDNNNCKDTLIVFVTEHGNPSAFFSTTENHFYTNEEINITNLSSSDAITFNYDFSDGSTQTIANPSISYPNIGTYNICLAVTNQFGCENNFCNVINIDEENIPLIIPNIFTPNGDESNDVFYINGLTTTQGISIFDRWGDKIFEEKPYLNNWKGKNKKGKIISEGTYYYIIEDSKNNKESVSGSFLITK